MLQRATIQAPVGGQYLEELVLYYSLLIKPSYYLQRNSSMLPLEVNEVRIILGWWRRMKGADLDN